MPFSKTIQLMIVMISRQSKTQILWLTTSKTPKINAKKPEIYINSGFFTASCSIKVNFLYFTIIEKVLIVKNNPITFERKIDVDISIKFFFT